MSTTTQLPGPKTRCRLCGATIAYALVMPSPTDRGGGQIALDAKVNPDGSVAVHQRRTRGRLYARLLEPDESYDHDAELPAMAHIETCGKSLVSEIEAFLADLPEAS